MVENGVSGVIVVVPAMKVSWLTPNVPAGPAPNSSLAGRR